MTDLARIEQSLDTWMDTHDVPGVAVGILFGDDVHVICRGVSNIDYPESIDADTLFPLASITKPFTATAFMRLVEAGKVDLDTPVQSYLPDLRLADPRAQQEVTSRHLLTHTAGFDGDVDAPHDWADDSLDRSLGLFNQLAQHFAPGELASYSNAGLRLLGILVQRLSGTPYESYVTENVLQPLGMPSTYFFPWDMLGRKFAVGHALEGGRLRVWPNYDLWRAELPEGGLVSSITDMLAWTRYQMHGSTTGNAPVSDSTRMFMQQPATPGPPPLSAIGLPWLISQRGDVHVVSHGGNHGNVSVSSLDMVPSHGLATVVLANARDGKVIGAKVLDWCLEELLQLSPAADLQPLDISRSELAEYEGSYDLALGTFVVATRDGGLRVTIVPRPEAAATHAEFPPVDLTPVAKDTFATPPELSRASCSFIRDDTGRVRFIHFMGRAAARQQA